MVSILPAAECFMTYSKGGIDPDSLINPNAGALTIQQDCVRRGFAAFHRDHPERANWHRIERHELQEGDALLMASRRLPWHAGVWVAVNGGRVLHAPESGAMLSRLADVQLAGWPQIEFYRHEPRT